MPSSYVSSLLLCYSPAPPDGGVCIPIMFYVMTVSTVSDWGRTTHDLPRPDNKFCEYFIVESGYVGWVGQSNTIPPTHKGVCSMSGEKGPKQERMSVEQFTRAFILKARTSWTSEDGVEHPAEGIHTVITKLHGHNFNEVYRAYQVAGKLQDGAPENPVDATNLLAAAGKLAVRRAKRGAYIILPEDMREGGGTEKASNILDVLTM